MLDNIHSTLAALKDVTGIQGSFVISAEGGLLAREMPSLFDDSIFEEAGPRISRLSETFGMLGDELESCVLRFTDHLLCFRQLAKGSLLCIMTSVGVNLPALKMAINLAQRRISNELATLTPENIAAAIRSPKVAQASAHASPAQGSTPPPAPIPVAAVTSVQHAPPASAEQPRKRARYYRGQLIEE